MMNLALSQQRIAQILGGSKAACCNPSEVVTGSTSGLGEGQSEKDRQYLIERKALLESYIKKIEQGVRIGDEAAFRTEIFNINEQLRLFSSFDNGLDSYLTEIEKAIDEVISVDTTIEPTIQQTLLVSETAVEAEPKKRGRKAKSE